ncbi:MAG: 50S ribosomal protein L1 [Alphaproteobacteria bacterium]|nr:50S ribosomal protein L1 [Alphaproteobacteria bacterium]
MSTKVKVKGGKRIEKIRNSFDSMKSYNLKDALEVLKNNNATKFDETVEIVMNLGVDASKSDQLVRGVAQMPNGTGKKIRVAAIVKGPNVEKAKAAGADIVGLEDVIEDIKAEKINFDICIATPDVMPKISPVAKILGTKGLMPNPKLGTVTMDVESAIKKVKAGQVKFRTEKAGIIHAGIGKLSFTLDALIGNVSALVDAVLKEKPTGSKGAYVKNVYVTSTMNPSLRVELSSVLK